MNRKLNELKHSSKVFQIMELIDIELGDIPGTESPPRHYPDNQENPENRNDVPPDFPRSNSFSVNDVWTTIPEKFENALFKQPVESNINKWLRFPFFTISVTIVNVALMIWVLVIGGFASPSQNPMLGK